MKKLFAPLLALLVLLVSATWADNLQVLDGTETGKYIKATGAGSNGDPMVTHTRIDAALPAGTNNIGDVDVVTLPATINVNNVTGSVTLPTGAATAAKQPALGTAGSSSSDVLTVQGAASMTPFVTTAITRVVTVSVTRPANTTAYTAGDYLTTSTSSPTVVSSSSMCRVNGGSGTIIGAHLIDSFNQTTKPDIDLIAFDATYTADNDNAVFTPTDGELETSLGTISFMATATRTGDATSGTGGNTLTPAVMANPISYQCAGGSTTLYFAPVFRSDYTPGSAEKFTFRLLVQQD